MLRVKVGCLVMAAGIMLSQAPDSHAQQLVGTYKAWRVFTVMQGGQKLCYLASLPTNKTGNYSKRDEPYLLVTHKSRNVDEVSVSSGYRYKDKSEVAFSFGQKKYDLFTKGELAWAYDTKTDMQLVKEMMKGSKVIIKGTSWKGTQSKDTYSLSGFTAAHRKMKQSCK